MSSSDTIFMDPDTTKNKVRGRGIHFSLKSAIENPNKWVIRSIRTDTTEDRVRLHALGSSTKRNNTAGKNWQYKVCRYNKAHFSPKQLESYGLNFDDISADTVIALHMRVSDSTI
jgi:hypothetical protein